MDTRKGLVIRGDEMNSLKRLVLISVLTLTGCAGMRDHYAEDASVAASQHCDTVWTDKIRGEYAAKRNEYLTVEQAMQVVRSGLSAANRIGYETCLRSTWDSEYARAHALGRYCDIRYQEAADYAACYLDKLDAHGYQPRGSGDVNIYTR